MTSIDAWTYNRTCPRSTITLFLSYEPGGNNFHFHNLHFSATAMFIYKFDPQLKYAHFLIKGDRRDFSQLIGLAGACRRAPTNPGAGTPTALWPESNSCFKTTQPASWLEPATSEWTASIINAHTRLQRSEFLRVVPRRDSNTILTDWSVLFEPKVIVWTKMGRAEPCRWQNKQ